MMRTRNFGGLLLDAFNPYKPAAIGRAQLDQAAEILDRLGGRGVSDPEALSKWAERGGLDPEAFRVDTDRSCKN